jgi:LacI family transcriptional regulator
MKPYVTLADVAKAADVSVMTVSLALRGAPRIPEATRTRIAELAREMGYQPNPMLSSLAAYRQQTRDAKYQATVAVISNSLERGAWRKEFPHQRMFWEGAQERGRELGYELEEFWLREPGMTQARFSKILLARNISGLLLLPQPRSRSHLNLLWEHFSPVAFGYSLTRPQLHVTAVHHFDSGMQGMRKLRALGYRRIGFVAVHEVIERANLTLLGGFLVEQNRKSQREQVPPLILPRAAMDQRAFEKWFLQKRPDAIFVCGLWHALMLEWLDQMKVDVPGELGVAYSNVRREGNEAGIDENTDLMGAKAMELVKAMIDRGEKGIPNVPLRILVEGTWRAGDTVRRVTG